MCVSKKAGMLREKKKMDGQRERASRQVLLKLVRSESSVLTVNPLSPTPYQAECPALNAKPPFLPPSTALTS